MKYVRSILPLVLLGALAAPTSAKRAGATPPASAVAIMRDSGQALLWDSARGEYLLVKAGDHVGAYFVVTIGEDSVIIAVTDNPTVRHVLRLAPARTSRSGKARVSRPTVITLAPEQDGGAALDVIDPYPDDGLEVVDPYAAPPGKTPTTVSPTVVLGGGLMPAKADPTVRKVRAPKRSAVEEAPKQAPAAPRPSPAAKRAPERPERVERAISLRRAELDEALADFDALAREVQVERAAGGGVEIVGLARGSLFHRAGLREGDVVRSVAGVRITTIESAALVYARVQSRDRFDVELDRGEQRVILAFTLE